MLALKDSYSPPKLMPPDYDNDVDEASGFSSDEDFDFEPGLLFKVQESGIFV
jgi:hypothetical protein